MKLQILPPDKAKKKAQERLAAWKRQNDLEKKRKELEARKPLSENQKQLNDELLRMVDGYREGYVEEKFSEYRSQNPDWYKQDGFDMNSLLASIHEPMIERVKELLAAGADPNAKVKHGNTPLIEAATNGDAQLIQLLIQNSADVNAHGSGGKTALMSASFLSNADALKVLIENNADLEAVDNEGWTALMHASYHLYPTNSNQWQGYFGSNPISTIRHLLESGAEPNAKNNDGKTVLRLVMEKHDDPEVIALLTKHGATE
jgi:ankyrin repeat protein